MGCGNRSNLIFSLLYFFLSFFYVFNAENKDLSVQDLSFCPSSELSSLLSELLAHS
jgi:hypothetical protein